MTYQDYRNRHPKYLGDMKIKSKNRYYLIHRLDIFLLMQQSHG